MKWVEKWAWWIKMTDSWDNRDPKIMRDVLSREPQ